MSPVAAARVRLVVVTSAVVVLAGCASAGGDPAPAPGATGTAATNTAPHALDPDTILTCQGVEVTAGALTDQLPASELPSELAALLEGSPVVSIDDLDDWFLAVSSDDHVVIMRELDQPLDLGAGDVRDFDLLSVSATPGAMPIDDTWGVDVSTSCTPRITLDGLGEVTLTLDPDAPPRADDRELSLLASESSCNSGQPATGRVEVVEIVETDTTVELVVGVAPQPQDRAYTCQSNPPTPFTVDLEHELADRAIVDASFVPAHEITMPMGRSVPD
ncbi:hypothetical protein BCL57_001652 [Agromyces flavus]|uniref:Lipoprotein n=1 Tax=Agromyces flavus TaxID=589382 RepID=A0A1H1LB59_9MICO|nr:hypothetical protein [Agromyces flavus]MCP2367498.1 hypothetical protein [Agromyces flavus]GGI45611.1 hypothetical protein GCM10010932_10420 [Agromyces flavus]SDR71667.1 hypothetical protein SAMN04489721_0063 [Agromyces flavus]